MLSMQTPPGIPLDGTRSLHSKKLGLLNICAICESFPPADVALIALAASDDPNIEVAGTAEYVLDTRCSQNGVLCCNELEDDDFVARVFELLAGSPTDMPHRICKRGAATPLRTRMYRLCCMSVTACNLSQRTLEVVRVCVEDIVDPRHYDLQHAACDFVLWVLENSSEDVVSAVAQSILDGAIYALNLLTVAAPTPSPPIRRLLYQAVGQIAERAPQAFKGDVTTAAGFFSKLATEPYGLSEAVNETVSRLVCAYTALPCPDVNKELQCMLKWQARGANERARTCAIVWAICVFPMDSDLHEGIECLSADSAATVNHQPTKLFEPDSYKLKAAAPHGSSSSSHAAELRRGWPEAWAAMQQQKVLQTNRLQGHQREETDFNNRKRFSAFSAHVRELHDTSGRTISSSRYDDVPVHGTSAVVGASKEHTEEPEFEFSENAAYWLTWMDGTDEQNSCAGSLHMWISNVHPPHSLAFASSQEAVSHRITWLMNEGGYTDVTSTPQLCTDLPKLAGRQGCNSRTLCALLTSLDIANGMRVLHESNTLHQNLTTHNVLLFTSHKDARGFNAKLSNFRLPEDAHELSFTVLKKRDQQYIAPEVIQTRVMTRKAEVFAFGVIMWELWHNMFFGSFVDQQAQPNRNWKYMDDCTPPVSSRCPKTYVQLMTRCLDSIPALRPNFLGGQFNVVSELELLIQEEYKKWLPAPRSYRRQPEMAAGGGGDENLNDSLTEHCAGAKTAGYLSA